MVTKNLEIISEGQSLKVYINADGKIFICIHPENYPDDPYQFQAIAMDLDDAKALRDELSDLIEEL